MRSTLFCLVLPGDSASARRTSEIFMAGCIPVFLGPPFGSMPLADDIDYKASSLFFNVSDYRWVCNPQSLSLWNKSPGWRLSFGKGHGELLPKQPHGTHHAHHLQELAG